MISRMYAADTEFGKEIDSSPFRISTSCRDERSGIRVPDAGGAIFTGTIACCSMTCSATSSRSKACHRMNVEYLIPFSERLRQVLFAKRVPVK
ncbi:MAG: hypothetical protein SPI66_00690 [Gemmiger qucibialis]|nr:hypothetical protein [Gemmiger qucibialis]